MSIWKALIGEEEVQVDRTGGVKLEKVGGFVPGCDDCPHRIHGSRLTGLVNVTGKRAIAIFPNVNDEEARAKRHMIGKAARWAWDVLKDYGIERELFDITSAVRCEPAEPEPSKEEYARCTTHNKLFIRKNNRNAKTWILWGKQTAEYILGKGKNRESSDPIFWSEKYGARMFLMEYPGPYQRSTAYPKHLSEMWERRYEAAAYSIRNPGQYTFVESLDIKGVYTPQDVIRVIREATDSGGVVVHDIENFEDQILCLGFAWKKQHARVVILDHPDNPATKAEKAEVWKLITEYLASSVEKAFHYGASDTIKLEERGISVNGFTVDTLFGHFLKYSYVRQHGLAAIALDRFPHYAGYKELVSKYYDAATYPKGLADCPLKTLVLYNGADCCLTWEIKEHILDGSDVDRNLLYVYVRASRMIYRMEARGPLFDREHVAMLRGEFPKHLESMLKELREYAGKADYNPGSWQQVAEVMYRTLELPTVMEIEGGSNPEPDDFGTDEESLNIIAEATDSPFVKLQLDYRKMNALMENTVNGAERSAAKFNGEVRTKWHLAGAATGRLRSGGDGDGGESIYINMQNLPSNPLGKNILCSYTEWRLVNEWIRDNINDFPHVPSKCPKDKDAPHKWEDFQKCPKCGETRVGDPRNDPKTFVPVTIPDWVLDSYIFVTRDMSQIEVRLAAEESQDKNLVKAFQDKLDIHCFHEETEILTQGGWIRVDRLVMGDLICTAKPERGGAVILGWEYPTVLTKRRNKAGFLVHVKTDRPGGMDLRVTSEHRMLGFTDQNGPCNPKDYTPETLASAYGWANAGVLDTGVYSTKINAARLAVAIQADGHCLPDGSVCFQFKKSRKKQRLVALLKKLGIAWTGSSQQKDRPGVSSYRISREQLEKEPWSEFLNADKTFNTRILECGYETRKAFIEELQHWDGTGYGTRFQYTSRQQVNVDIVQAVAVTVNKGTTVGNYNGQAVIQVMDRRLSRRKLKTERISHNGMVYCLSVPSGYVVARDKGTAVVVGQCVIGTEASQGKWTWDEVKNDDNIRRTAKAVGFSVLYGTKENGLYIRLRAQGVQVTLDDVADLLKGYFTRFSGVTDLMDQLDLEVERTGGITTRFGFRRHIGEDFQGKRKSSTKNQPLNTLIQSSAHTLMLLVQCLIDEDPIKYDLLTQMTMEIHDALYWYVRLRDAPEALKIAKKLMEEEVQDLIEALWGFRFTVPILSDGGAGYRFGAMAKLKKDDVTVYDILGQWYNTNAEVEKKMAGNIAKGLRK